MTALGHTAAAGDRWGCPLPPDVPAVARTRVLLVDDHPIVVPGVRRLLSRSPEFDVVGQASTGLQAMEAALSTNPDLILLGSQLPDIPPPRLCRRLHGLVPGARFVVVTAFIEGSLLRDCLASGVAGVLLDGADGLDLVGDLRRIRSGLMVIDGPSALAAAGTGEPCVEGTPLSRREHQLLRLIAEGMSTKGMAGELRLSPNTVRSYCESLLRKLRANSRIQAVAHARASGLL